MHKSQPQRKFYYQQKVYTLDQLLKLSKEEVERLYLDHKIHLLLYQDFLSSIASANSQDSQYTPAHEEVEVEREEEEEKAIYHQDPIAHQVESHRFEKPKKLTFIMMDDEDQDDNPQSFITDNYLFLGEKPKNRIITISNAIDLLENPIQQDEVIFMPELGMAIAYHNEDEIQFNNTISNGISMYHPGSIESVSSSPNTSGDESTNQVDNSHKNEKQTTEHQNWGIDRIKAKETNYTGEDVTIAVIDTGIDLKHPDFSNTKITSYALIEGNMDDINGHGTHCASIALGSNGVAPKANLIAIKVLDRSGRGEEYSLLLAIMLALHKGAHIISFSIKLENGERGLSRDAFDALIKLARREYACPVICAAGNDSIRPKPIKRIGSPADSHYAFAINAIDDKCNFYVHANRADDNLEQHMSYTAPGVDILAARSQQKLFRTTELYELRSGTSMAVPFISGTIALIIEKINSKYRLETGSVTRIKKELKEITEMIPVWEEKDAGKGIPNIAKL